MDINNRITPVLLKTGQIILEKYSIGRSLRMGLIWLDFRLLVYNDAVDSIILQCLKVFTFLDIFQMLLLQTKCKIDYISILSSLAYTHIKVELCFSKFKNID